LLQLSGLVSLPDESYRKQLATDLLQLRHDSVLEHARRRGTRRHLVWFLVVRSVVGCGNVLHTNVVPQRRLSSVFFSPSVQDFAHIPVYTRCAWSDLHAKRCALVGSKPPPASQAFGWARRFTFATSPRFLVVPHGLVPRWALGTDGSCLRR
jgi:hypothetical protein